MAAITPQIYKKVIPKSKADSNYEEFEFLLGWYGRDGQFITKMFTDFEVNDQVQAGFINLSSTTDLQNIIESKSRNRQVVAEDLTLNDLKVLSSIYEAKKIIRIKKDGTAERIGLLNNSVKYRQSGARYDLPIDLILAEEALAQ